MTHVAPGSSHFSLSLILHVELVASSEDSASPQLSREAPHSSSLPSLEKALSFTSWRCSPPPGQPPTTVAAAPRVICLHSELHKSIRLNRTRESAPIMCRTNPPLAGDAGPLFTGQTLRRLAQLTHVLGLAHTKAAQDLKLPWFSLMLKPLPTLLPHLQRAPPFLPGWLPHFGTHLPCKLFLPPYPPAGEGPSRITTVLQWTCLPISVSPVRLTFPYSGGCLSPKSSSVPYSIHVCQTNIISLGSSYLDLKVWFISTLCLSFFL